MNTECEWPACAFCPRGDDADQCADSTLRQSGKSDPRMLTIRRAMQGYFCTRAHRQRVGGTWYHVEDPSSGWPIRHWTQAPAVDDSVVEVERYTEGAVTACRCGSTDGHDFWQRD